VIVVLGQTYKIDRKDFSSASTNGTFREESTRLPPLGTLVAVLGERDSNGIQVATTVRAVRSRYVPGATDIYLLGVAAAYDATIAVAKLGGTQVFIGDIDGEFALAIGPGALVEIVGRQSHPGGQVWATALRIVREAPVFSEEAASAEATVQSITGTGASSQSITGTGVSAQSITGTGVSIQSITGTGASAQSITGTGLSIQSITGTGVSAQSITGTGLSIQSITGTGVSAQSITGTGASS
jgi:hypothetical protein